MKKSFFSVYLLPFVCSSLLFIFPTSGSANEESLINELKAGNERFLSNRPEKSATSYKEAKRQAEGQTPFATIVCCSDSRVPPEILFDQGLGEIFIIRLAGNSVDTFALATIEFGVNFLKTPLLVVLGHSHCGAVEASFSLDQETFSPELTKLLRHIEPAATFAKKTFPNEPRSQQVEKAIEQNVRLVEKEILERIPSIKDKNGRGEVTVKGAVFHLENGKVTWLD